MILHGLGDGSRATWRDTICLTVGGIVQDWGPLFRSGAGAMVRMFLWDIPPTADSFGGLPETDDSERPIEHVHMMSSPSGMPRTEWVMRWFDGRDSLDRLAGFGWVDSAGGNGRIAITQPYRYVLASEEGRVRMAGRINWTSDDDLQTLLWGGSVKR